MITEPFLASSIIAFFQAVILMLVGSGMERSRYAVVFWVLGSLSGIASFTFAYISAWT